MVAISGVKKAIFDRLCKQLEKIGQQMNGEPQDSACPPQKKRKTVAERPAKGKVSWHWPTTISAAGEWTVGSEQWAIVCCFRDRLADVSSESTPAARQPRGTSRFTAAGSVISGASLTFCESHFPNLYSWFTLAATSRNCEGRMQVLGSVPVRSKVNAWQMFTRIRMSYSVWGGRTRADMLAAASLCP